MGKTFFAFSLLLTRQRETALRQAMLATAGPRTPCLQPSQEFAKTFRSAFMT
jgi:hypothetical protein